MRYFQCSYFSNHITGTTPFLLSLFLEKGYENTTIQDIIQSLNGLSKGAIYHHFNSKEEILDVLVDRLLAMYNPFPEVMNRSDLNGLEKLREVTRRSLVEYGNSDIGRSNTSLLKNPNILARMIEKGHVLFSPAAPTTD